MLEHEQFEELSALAAIGQLSEEEHRELVTHLRDCEACKRTQDDFAFILDQLPAADPPQVSEDAAKLLGESHRRKFLERATAEGLHFTRAAVDANRPRFWRLSVFQKRQFFAITAAAACLIIAGSVRIAIRRSAASRRMEQVSAVAPSPVIPLAPSQQITVAPEAANSPSTAIHDSERQIQLLKQQLVLATQERNTAESEAERLKQELARVTTAANQTAENYSTASSALQKLQNEQAQFLAALVEKQNKIQDLTDEMAAEKASAEREQQLTAAARDVRELMGARNLHIIDVFDFDGRQRRDKSFGRVFYAAGKSLIFYAFDLGQKGPASKVSFQAWGQSEGRAASAKNLGIFHVDDHAQKTWVLRVDDPQLLSSIDSVFVTIEPVQGADKPSGKRLLYAYLGAQPNHP
jgi:hypothetical protein